MNKKYWLTIAAFIITVPLSWIGYGYANTTNTNSALDYKQLPGIAAIKNKDGVILWANNKSVKLAGTSLVGKTDQDPSISWHNEGKQFMARDQEAMAAGHQKAFVEFTQNNGVKTTYITYINPTRDTGGEINGVAVIAFKIDEMILQQINAAVNSASVKHSPE